MPTPPPPPAPHRRRNPYYAEPAASARGGMLNQLAQARCPKCNHPMVARLGRRGPYFHCGCLEKP